MKYIKLNKNWNAEPNAPEVSVSKTDYGLEITFLLNSLIFQHIDVNEKGSLEFHEVYAYRIDPTNDEGYYSGKFRSKNVELPWGEFYELIDSNWKNNFPSDMILLNDSIPKRNLRHFIFFLKD